MYPQVGLFSAQLQVRVLADPISWRSEGPRNFHTLPDSWGDILVNYSMLLYLMGYYWDNGKENGNYCRIIGYILLVRVQIEAQELC